MQHTTTCPSCHRKSEVDDSFLGRFICCEQCRCLYYVVVPPLGEERSEWTSVAATSSVSGRDDKDPVSRRPVTETEILSRRVQLLTAMISLNLVIGSIVLVLVVIQLLK